MIKVLLTVFGLTLAVATSFGQAPKDLLLQIKNSRPDVNKVKLQLQLADYYLHQAYQTPAQLDSAVILANSAILLASGIHNETWENKALWCAGNAYFQKKDTVSGMACFTRSRSYYHKKGDQFDEARAWNEEGTVYPASGKMAAAYKLKCYNNALTIFNRLNRNMEIAEVIQNIGGVHTHDGEFSMAEKEFMQVLTLYKKIGYKKLHPTYGMLANIYSLNGNPDKEVFYLLETVKNMQSTGDSTNASGCYYRLSVVYTIIGKREEGLTWIRKAIAAKKGYEILMYTEMINDLTALKHTKEALDTINTLAKRPPPVNDEEKVALYQSLGFCYTKLNQNKKAEEYYLKMVAVDLDGLKRRDIFLYTNLYLAGNDAIAWFYIHSHQTPKARKYLSNMMAVYKSPPATIFPVYRINTYQGMYAVEYESHHYREAIHYLQLHKNLYDSLFNADKNRQLEEFKVKYETDQREKDIKLLESHAIVQNATIQKARLQRNITFAGIAMVIIIAGLAYNGYRHKQQSNTILQAKQVEINMQNNALQSLLTEKDWLLKEVHHRVKNNLQIIMSLLNTQSVYLQNNDAINAIRESQNRVQSISLIHQKLYSTSNIASIDMPAYIADLVNYLSDGFDTHSRNIRFEQLIGPIKMDLAQSVPLGLILNEAITNAIKYAFTQKGGTITIVMEVEKQDMVMLTVADNGRGLPPDFDLKTANSLGMEMMKALSKQLGGIFTIKSESGTTINIQFKLEPLLSGDQKEKFYA